MKKILVLAIAFVFVAAGAAMAGVLHTAHDLSTYTGVDDQQALGHGVTSNTDETCVHCHSPHGTSSTAMGTVDATKNILFNRAVGSGENGTKTCMACHDGSIGTLVNNPGTGLAGSATIVYNGTAGAGAGNNTLWESIGMGGKGSNSHPINIGPGSEPDFVTSSTVMMSNLAAGYVKNVSNADTVQCTSCHEPHRTTYGLFLRSTNAGSALCITCHIK